MRAGRTATFRIDDAQMRSGGAWRLSCNTRPVVVWWYKKHLSNMDQTLSYGWTNPTARAVGYLLNLQGSGWTLSASKQVARWAVTDRRLEPMGPRG